MILHSTRESFHVYVRLILLPSSSLKKWTAIGIALGLSFLLYGCSTLLNTKDEDKVTIITDMIPLLPINKQQSTDIIISERGRSSKAVQWLRSSTKSLEKGKWSKAISAADVAISIEPTMYDAYTMRGLAYLMRDSVDRAISDCSEAISLQSSGALAYACRGSAYAKKDSMSTRGKADLDMVQSLAHAIPEYVISGDKEDEVAKYGAACVTGISFGCTQYKKMVGHFPASVEKKLAALISKSDKMFITKNWDEVINITSEALLIDERNLVALCNRSGAYANKNMIKEASADATSAVSSYPGYSLAYNNRGWVRELSSQLEDALTDYDTACARGLKSGCTNASRLRTQKGIK
jgi:tetratricopeptide (TPR) repeat protein